MKAGKFARAQKPFIKETWIGCVVAILEITSRATGRTGISEIIWPVKCEAFVENGEGFVPWLLE